MIKHELPKIREGFLKVKNDMLFLSEKITENYTEFIKHHKDLSKEIHHISTNLQDQINHIKTNLKQTPEKISSHELSKIKSEISELKKIVSTTHGEHLKLTTIIEDVKKDKKDIKQLKEKLHSSELELFLLKEKIQQKDLEITELKDISRKMFDLIDDLSRVELDLVNHELKT